MKDNNKKLNQDEVAEMVDVLMEYFGRDEEGNLYNEPLYSYHKLFFLAVCFLIAETADGTEQSISKVYQLANKWHNNDELNEFHRAFEICRYTNPESLAVQYYDKFIQVVQKGIVMMLTSISTTFKSFLFIPDKRCNYRCNLTFAEILNMGKEEVRQKREDEIKWYKSIKTHGRHKKATTDE